MKCCQLLNRKIINLYCALVYVAEHYTSAGKFYSNLLVIRYEMLKSTKEIILQEY